MPGRKGKGAPAALALALGLGGCAAFETTVPDISLMAPADDACFEGVDLATLTPAQRAAVERGDDLFTWECEAPASDEEKLSNALHWFRNSVEYRVVAASTYARAQESLTALVRRRGSGWFVIMDADETLLDNSDYSKEYERCGTGYWSPSWCVWSREEKARAVPGAVEFTHHVRELGGFVAVVSNREARETQWTAHNLDALGFAYDAILLSEGDHDKTARWLSAAAALGNRATAPVMWIGDQITDFPVLSEKNVIAGAMSQESAVLPLDPRFNPKACAKAGVCFVLLPQPTYSGPEGWMANEAE